MILHCLASCVHLCKSEERCIKSVPGCKDFTGCKSASPLGISLWFPCLLTPTSAVGTGLFTRVGPYVSNKDVTCNERQQYFSANFCVMILRTFPLPSQSFCGALQTSSSTGSTDTPAWLGAKSQNLLKVLDSSPTPESKMIGGTVERHLPSFL